MAWFSTALIYIAFFALIGLAVWLTDSAVPLWALLLGPSIGASAKSKEGE